ncbi:DUF2057 family protein [Marinobacter salicampi]|uniref:DUF2057 family protein n=1 Tax=Marinobacter salicampi TaxID=435907 RepID=UPI00140D1FEA|nr:DUF2057 family protein [Marinobacter salicampi]
MSRVQTWDGAKAEPGQVAVLKTPGEIKVQSVNGRRTGSFLLDDLELDYELLPGRNEVVFTYETIWAKKTVVRNGESKVHTVSTEPQKLVIDAQAGETYIFELPDLSARKEAEAFADSPTLAVTNEAGKVVATASERTAPTPSLPTLAGADDSEASEADAEKDESQVVNTGARAMAGEKLGTVEALKVMWERASADEKREFLRWAFE